MVEMDVKGLTVDPFTQMPVLILKSKNSKDILPLWIGTFEANSIALELENIKKPRPMTYDLIKNILDTLDINVRKIYITDIEKGTFYAKLEIVSNGSGKTEVIDARPSDAINIALRCKAPILVSKEVIKKVKEEEEEEINLEDLEEIIGLKESI